MLFLEAFSFATGPVVNVQAINTTTSVAAITITEKLVVVQERPVPPEVVSLGLVGDLCGVSIRNCSKYMECKVHASPFVNGSFCTCLTGYVSNFERNCSKLYI